MDGYCSLIRRIRMKNIFSSVSYEIVVELLKNFDASEY